MTVILLLSTLLRLPEPTAGKAIFDGTDVRALDAEQMRAMRRMQIVFQYDNMPFDVDTANDAHWEGYSDFNAREICQKHLCDKVAEMLGL